MKIAHEGPLNGQFTGFNSDMIFCFANRTYWLQAVYRYWYHYAYRPNARVIEKDGQYFIEIAGQSVQVKRVTDVIDSTIDGEFKGWEGETVYRLTNGQTWQQSSYRYEYKYAYRPNCLIYRSNSGYTMAVDGTTAPVRRI